VEEKPQQVLFPVRGTGRVLFGENKKAVNGVLDFSQSQRLEYRFEGYEGITDYSRFLSRPLSFELAYSFNAPANAVLQIPGQVILELGEEHWVLPIPSGGVFIHYAVPVSHPLPETFSIYFEKNESKRKFQPNLQIRSVELKERWFGRYMGHGAFENRLYLTPFVSHRSEDSSWLINIPAEYSAPSGLFPVFNANLLSGEEGVLTAGNQRFESLSPASGAGSRFTIPAGIIPPGTDRLFFSYGNSENADPSFRIHYEKLPMFPEPISADPGLVLEWPVELWRDSRYEIFRWDRFPSFLIFDTASYVVQDRLVKRLAFFVEKTGFR